MYAFAMTIIIYCCKALTDEHVLKTVYRTSRSTIEKPRAVYSVITVKQIYFETAQCIYIYS